MRVFAAIAAVFMLLPAAADTAPLAAFDVGAYADLVSRPNPEGHSIVFVPSLVSVLLAAEQGSGAALGEAEVLSLCDRAGAMAVPAESARKLEDGRGYKDLDPDRCWQEWQEQRQELINP